MLVRYGMNFIFLKHYIIYFIHKRTLLKLDSLLGIDIKNNGEVKTGNSYLIVWFYTSTYYE